jgi:hypothetical protein
MVRYSEKLELLELITKFQGYQLSNKEEKPLGSVYIYMWRMFQKISNM